MSPSMQARYKEVRRSQICASETGVGTLRLLYSMDPERNPF